MGTRAETTGDVYPPQIESFITVFLVKDRSKSSSHPPPSCAGPRSIEISLLLRERRAKGERLPKLDSQIHLRLHLGVAITNDTAAAQGAHQIHSPLKPSDTLLAIALAVSTRPPSSGIIAPEPSSARRTSSSSNRGPDEPQRVLPRVTFRCGRQLLGNSAAPWLPRHHPMQGSPDVFENA